MVSLLIAMNCPRCGGPLTINEGAEMASCPFCSALLAIEGDDDIQRLTFRNLITGEEAEKAVKDWWLDRSIAYDTRHKGRIVESFPLYVPFWKLRGTVIGWVCGEGKPSERYDDDVPREVAILEERELTRIACDPGDLGIKSLENFEGDMVFYEMGTIPVFDVTVSRTAAESTILRMMEANAVRDSGVSNITFRRVDAFPVSLSILYYPVWIVRYMYNDRMYSATIDGISGNVLAGRAPDNAILRSLVLATGMAVGGFVPMLCIGLIMAMAMNGLLSITLAIATVVIPLSIFIAFMTYAFFRRDIEWKKGSARDKHTQVGTTGKVEYWSGNKANDTFVHEEEQPPCE